MIRRLARVASVAMALAALGCDGGYAAQQPAQSMEAHSLVQINGAGATFPYPIYSRWFSEYNRQHPNVRINYQSIGSGGGIRQLTNRTVFFGATDGPMSDQQLQAAPGPILHFPTVLGAVVPIYNVQGAGPDLKLSGPVLADIYLGKIRTWNDPAIARLNPGATLPATAIAVVHRSDGSGTTYIFVDYLSKVSPEFKERIGVNTSVNWPAGVGGKGNEGVAGLVAHTPGTIGYVELIYALQNTISYASVQNAAGEFVKASPDSVTKAAAAASIPDDFRVSITNAPGLGAYPISSFTWLLLYENPSDVGRATVMANVLRWAITDGQTFAAGLGYAPLPDSVVKRELAVLERLGVS